MGQFTTSYIRDSYTWLKFMRMKRRWRPGGPTVLAVRGAELVREKPSEAEQAPIPEQESTKGRRRGREPQTTE
jgi:hypothetical protein